MPSCPITLVPVQADLMYSEAGLKSIHPRLKHLETLPYSNHEQLRQARLRSDKMSIQGVQPKLSAVLSATPFSKQARTLLDTRTEHLRESVT